MIRYGLLGAAATLALAAPVIAQAQAVMDETVPPASATAPVQTGPSAPANSTIIVVPGASQQVEVQPAPPTPTSQWIRGGWAWSSTLERYSWVPGHYIDTESPQPALEYPATWIPGHYVDDGNGLVWVEGHWE
jgi:hypothetical protein